MGQFKEFDLIKEHPKPEKKQVIYLTAVWCKPCMEKLQPVIDSFGSKEQYDLIVLLDQNGVSGNIIFKLQELYDVSFIRLLPSRYYPQKSSAITIRVNPSNKVIKKFTDDVNTNFGVKFSTDDLWFGSALVSTPKGLYLTKASEKEGLIKEIQSQLALK
jgi:hypothetical protein